MHDSEEKCGIYAELTKDPLPNVPESVWGAAEETAEPHGGKENFPLRFADMTDRPLSYGYARIFSKADVK